MPQGTVSSLGYLGEVNSSQEYSYCDALGNYFLSGATLGRKKNPQRGICDASRIVSSLELIGEKNSSFKRRLMPSLEDDASSLGET
jgi:hypothetical protein